MKIRKKHLVATLLTLIFVSGLGCPSLNSNAEEPKRYDYNDEIGPYNEQIQAILSGNKKNTDKEETDVKLAPEYGKKNKKNKKSKNAKKNKKKDTKDKEKKQVETATASDATPSDASSEAENNDDVQETAPVKTYIGSYELTAYIATGNPCASGVYPTVEHTVACNSLPMGTRIYIEGYGEFVVEDTGGMADNVIDIFVSDYDTAIEFGRRIADVYVIE